MPKANTRPVSGTRDFLPLDVLRRNYAIHTIEQVYQLYGFEPLETPVMERLETLLGKYGDEGDQLIFRVLKRGEKLARVLEREPSENNLSDAGLRYDLTVPLARVAAEYRSQLPRFFKRYQIQPVYRADRPARGRFREFYQCDLDIVGSGQMTVETEVLSAAAEVLDRLGFDSPGDYRLRLNHRVVLHGLMHASGVPTELEEITLVAIDKADKIGMDGIRAELQQRNLSPETRESLMRLLADSPTGNEQCLEWLGEQLQDYEPGLSALEDLRKIIHLSEGTPAAKRLAVDPYLARGLSYYTGPIFEVEIAGYRGSAGGGGRYDGLIGMFSGRRIPACGFSLGLERVLMIMEEKHMFPKRLAGQPQILVTVYNEDTLAASVQTARLLRDAGIASDLFPEPGKYGKQFKYADQRGIRYALLLGPEEISKKTPVLKDLETGRQREVPWEVLAEEINDLLRGPGTEPDSPETE